MRMSKRAQRMSRLWTAKTRWSRDSGGGRRGERDVVEGDECAEVCEDGLVYEHAEEA